MLAEHGLWHALEMNRFHRRDRLLVLNNAKRDGKNRPISAVTIESHQHLRRTLKSKDWNIEFLKPAGSFHSGA